MVRPALRRKRPGFSFPARLEDAFSAKQKEFLRGLIADKAAEAREKLCSDEHECPALSAAGLLADCPAFA
jgi:hypothetical protein